MSAEPQVDTFCGSANANAAKSALHLRCSNPKTKEYQYYGGRGIRVCDEWNNDFEAFATWALNNDFQENAKRGDCTIDRIDVNGNYEPSNCRWVSQKVQCNNKRNNKVVI